MIFLKKFSFCLWISCVRRTSGPFLFFLLWKVKCCKWLIGVTRFALELLLYLSASPWASVYQAIKIKYALLGTLMITWESFLASINACLLPHSKCLFCFKGHHSPSCSRTFYQKGGGWIKRHVDKSPTLFNQWLLFVCFEK